MQLKIKKPEAEVTKKAKYIANNRRPKLGEKPGAPVQMYCQESVEKMLIFDPAILSTY